MADFVKTMAQGGIISEEDQKKTGAPITGTLAPEHRKFLENVKHLIQSGAIDPYDPKTFLKQEVYATLEEPWLEKIDLALLNIAGLLKQLYELYISTNTPDESPQYQTMIEELWEMKQRIEAHHDVFKF